MKPRKRLWAQIILPSNPKICVKSKLDNWVTDQKKRAPAGDLKRILLKLRNYGRFNQALQVYEWMRKKGIYKFSSSDYAVQFNLICKVRGCSAAEHYVRNLPKQARNDKTCGELLGCYVQAHTRDIWESPLLHLQKMKELGFALSPRPFNEIIRIIAYNTEKVVEVLTELKKSKVSPDNDSYRLCISSFGFKSDLDGMERMLKEMESQPHIVMDWCTYAVVAMLYESVCVVDKATDALEKARVLLLQNKDIRRKSPNYLFETEYRNVIESLVKLGELDEAMKFMDKWEASDSSLYLDVICIRYTIIEEYIKNGKLREAFYKIDEWSRKWINTQRKVDLNILSRLLCKEYLKVGNVFQAFKCFRGTVHAFENPPTVSFEIHPNVLMLFFKYLEEDAHHFSPCAALDQLNLLRPQYS